LNVASGTVPGGADLVVSGPIQYNPIHQPGAGIIKAGAGTAVLSGANTYYGTTTVSNGTLLVSGSLVAGSAVTVGTNATLGGTGAIGGTVVVDGTVSPGASVGTLTTGGETWNAGSRLICQVASATNSAGRDFLNILGTLDLEGTGPIYVKLVSMANSNTPGLVPDFDPSANYTWAVGAATGLTLNNPNLVLDTTGFGNSHTGTFSLNLDLGLGQLQIVYTAAVTTPVATLTTPAAGASYPAYGTVPLSATVETNGNVISNVAFEANGAPVATVMTPPYTSSWPLAAPGSYTVVARAYYGATNAVSTNSAGITVNPVVTPAISALVHNGSGYSFTVTGTNGQHYTIVSSTNVAASLATWATNQQGFYGAGNTVSYTNTPPLDAKRFFDVKTP